MSVEEYAEECGEWWDNHEDRLDSTKDLKDALADWRSLDPPAELDRFHNFGIEALELNLERAEVMDSLDDKLDDMDDLREKLAEATRRRERSDIEQEMLDLHDEADDQLDYLEDLGDDIEDFADDEPDLLDDLPRRVRRKLEEGGCL